MVFPKFDRAARIVRVELVRTVLVLSTEFVLTVLTVVTDSFYYTRSYCADTFTVLIALADLGRTVLILFVTDFLLLERERP